MAARKKTDNSKFLVYPEPRALESLGAVHGERAPMLNQAVEVFADLIARATLDNEPRFARKEWCAICDANNGTWFSPGIDPMVQVAANVEDADRLEGLGAKWGIDAIDVAKRLAGLDTIHNWAVVWVVVFFWSVHERVNTDTDEWWTLAYRREAVRASVSSV